ncbi:magnesium and cobalt transport protein CorA [Schumannella soli]|uniref:Magnesium and cobalt transport protein CorA n=1 Tax=Schumannella soli TaxID=2590779 RepID=A0A506Y5R2_9MICO|nr:magnesium and cobalt transport protein CorA [Schumannella soli]TPW77342.1 magnesium and cobalt transport protein CorA [Schumannella soli]
MTLIDTGIYRDGARLAAPPEARLTSETLEGTHDLAWIGLLRPTAAQLAELAEEFDLHPLAVEDAQKGHQRAKLERYDHTLFLVLRPAWLAAAPAAASADGVTVESGEIHVFAGPHFVITVRHADRPSLAGVRARLEANPQALCGGSEAVLAAILDEVVDGYAPVVHGLQEGVDALEDELLLGKADPAASQRIYHLLSQVIDFQRAIGPLPDMLHGLLRGSSKYGADDEVQNQVRNVLDHALRITERADAFRALLESLLTLHSTLVTQEQNEGMRRMTRASLAQGEESRRLAQIQLEQGEQTKKITSWAAILFAPTLIAGVYGMNFDAMPELHWAWGYPFAIALMLGLGAGLWFVFKRKRWL